MYLFTDTNGTQEAASLPSEAVSFNGKWLDQEIDGFRTLSVSGRELTSRNVNSDTNGKYCDGASFISAQIPKKEIVVTYQLLTGSNEAFRQAYNKLNELLKGDQKQLIFADEPDKYFIATKTDHKDGDAGTNCVVGEITFLCLDPFKHAVMTQTYTATAIDGILTAKVTNNGNVAVPIRYELTMNSDNGYIGIASDQGAMEYGYKEEVDGETVQETETLVTLKDFINASDDTSGTDGVHKDNYSHAGALGTNTTWISGKKFLCLSSDTGTANHNGGMRTVTLPADSQGETGAANFYCYLHLFLGCNANGQTGNMMLSFLTEDDKPICVLNWFKNDMTGNTGGYELIGYDSTSSGTASYKAGVKILKTFTYTCDNNQGNNPWYWNWGHCDIKKVGSQITFYYFGKYYTYDLPDTADMVCKKIQITMHNAKDRSGAKAWARRGIDVLRFQKTNVEHWQDNPNRYSQGDEVIIDGEEGKIYVNGMPKMGDEVTGTEYFKAEPGENTIEFYQSSWAENMTVKATIREAWL